MSVYILPGNISKLEETTKCSLLRAKKKTIYDIALKDEREMKILSRIRNNKGNLNENIKKKCKQKRV